jgi:hypothetical protein
MSQPGEDPRKRRNRLHRHRETTQRLIKHVWRMRLDVQPEECKQGLQICHD